MQNLQKPGVLFMVSQAALLCQPVRHAIG